MDKPLTQHSIQTHHIQCRLDTLIHRRLTSHRLRTQRVQPTLLLALPTLLHPSRHPTRAARTSPRRLPVFISRMSSMSTMTTRQGLWVLHRTGLEARSRTKRFAIPSSERFVSETDLVSLLNILLLLLLLFFFFR